MPKSLRFKFLALLISVVAIGLSATLLLRELMVRDFRSFLEGEQQDRAYWVTASLESSYERYSGWNRDNVIENTVWALMLGLYIELFDSSGQLIMDSNTAFSTLPLLIKKRVGAVDERMESAGNGITTPYTLFLGGRQIGHIEVRFLPPSKENIFIGRSNRFLLISLMVLGGFAVFLSIVFSRRMTRPIIALTTAVSAIEEGDFKSRVLQPDSDELGGLAVAFNKMASRLELQEGLRKRLSSNMAHELRTPLSAIRGELEAMMDGLLPSDKASLQSLYTEIGRLKGIIDGIEDLSQTEAGSLNVRRQRLSLHSFLRGIIDRFRKSFLEKGVGLELFCADNASLDTDPDKLSQIIINLLDNALKATGGGRRVWVRVTTGQDRVDIEVADTGCGIKESDIPYIFERFYKASKGGLGIGLTIVKELTGALGGKIAVQSAEGEGSVFKISFPQ